MGDVYRSKNLTVRTPGAMVLGQNCMVHGPKSVVRGRGAKVYGRSSEVAGMECDVYARDCKVSGRECRIWLAAEGCHVSGRGCTVAANRCIVTGAKCIVKGDRCIVKGEGCIVEGNRCAVLGNGCTVRGDDCEIGGLFCKDEGARNRAAPFRVAPPPSELSPPPSAPPSAPPPAPRAARRAEDDQEARDREYALQILEEDDAPPMRALEGAADPPWPFESGPHYGAALERDEAPALSRGLDPCAIVIVDRESASLTLTIGGASYLIEGCAPVQYSDAEEIAFPDFKIRKRDGMAFGATGGSLALIPDFLTVAQGTAYEYIAQAVAAAKRADAAPSTANNKRKRADPLDGEDAEEDDDERACVICRANVRRVKPRSCQHFAYCLGCAKKIDMCSICKRPINRGWERLVFV